MSGLPNRHAHFTSFVMKVCLLRAYKFWVLQPGDAGDRIGRGGVPQLGESIEQLLRAIKLIQSTRETHVIVMETMQIMARIENDERVVKMARLARRLA